MQLFSILAKMMKGGSLLFWLLVIFF